MREEKKATEARVRFEQKKKKNREKEANKIWNSNAIKNLFTFRFLLDFSCEWEKETWIERLSRKRSLPTCFNCVGICAMWMISFNHAVNYVRWFHDKFKLQTLWAQF